MKYNPKKKSVSISMADYDVIGKLLFSSLVEIRKAYHLPLDKYEREGGPLQREDHAQKNLLEIAHFLGIDLGGNWGNEIDLREFDT